MSLHCCRPAVVISRGSRNCEQSNSPRGRLGQLDHEHHLKAHISRKSCNSCNSSPSPQRLDSALLDSLKLSSRSLRVCTVQIASNAKAPRVRVELEMLARQPLFAP